MPEFKPMGHYGLAKLLNENNKIISGTISSLDTDDTGESVGSVYMPLTSIKLARSSNKAPLYMHIETVPYTTDSWNASMVYRIKKFLIEPMDKTHWGSYIVPQEEDDAPSAGVDYGLSPYSYKLNLRLDHAKVQKLSFKLAQVPVTMAQIELVENIFVTFSVVPKSYTGVNLLGLLVSNGKKIKFTRRDIKPLAWLMDGHLLGTIARVKTHSTLNNTTVYGDVLSATGSSTRLLLVGEPWVIYSNLTAATKISVSYNGDKDKEDSPYISPEAVYILSLTSGINKLDIYFE